MTLIKQQKYFCFEHRILAKPIVYWKICVLNLTNGNKQRWRAEQDNLFDIESYYQRSEEQFHCAIQMSHVPHQEKRKLSIDFPAVLLVFIQLKMLQNFNNL